MKEKLVRLLKQQHLLWVQRATMDPELHAALVLEPDCLKPEHLQLLEEDAQAVLDLILGKETG
jgi:hypothetical protein